MVALVWLVLVVSLASLSSLFLGAGWWFAGAGVSAVVLGASGLVRSLRGSPWLAWLVGLLAGTATATAVVSGGTAVLGVVPTAATLQRVRDLSDQAALTISDGTAPVPVDDGVLATVVGAVLVVSLLVDLLASVGRLPGATGLFPAVVLAVPAFVPTAETRWPWVVATVLLYLLLLMVSSGRRPTPAGAVGAVAAVAVAGLVTSLVPLGGVSPLTGVASGTGLATGVNPIIDLGDDLRRGAPVSVLTYRSSDEQGTYLKLVDLVDFSGRSWSPADVELDPDATVDVLPEAPGVDADTTRRAVETRVTIGVLRSPYLPVPVPPTEITGIDDGWSVVDESGVTVRSDDESTQGLEYTVRSRPVDPTEDEVVATLGDAPADMAPYLAVDGVPATVSEQAAAVTADAANPFDAAVALQDWFRDGDFTYSEETPVDQGYDGSGLDAVETFLRVRSGYCVHFASAMAVMARTLGIPSRVAVGFLPGESTGFADDQERTVSSDDLHTWPELYFQGLGWVPFEPTVGLGRPQSFLQETGVEPTAAPTDPAEATPTPTAEAPATTGPDAPTATPSDPARAAGSSGNAAVTAVPAGLAALLVLLVLALVVPSGLRAGRRRRRLAAEPPDAALRAWQEVLDTADDLRLDVPRSATPGAAAEVLAAHLGVAPGGRRRHGSEESRAALDRVVTALTTERFAGRPAEADVGRDARRVVDALRASSTPRRRAAALLAPRSLWASTGARRPRRA
ncbi:hypothetical protein F1C15_14605 [Frigoribacterium sp. NBH87]|uniref:transglutaminaseTgpA domain-containing protein n=1 Tax=Frigoribacterium sp. NBH87 TaxID=2596916 RepID=UPI00162543B2|nr:transglutaminaseTgpA domain-containing protein [Frigoribacterium sp. NBH87]QNE44879.1 hypothetical protein F1C15_14605 [Frigoribacterium sp. NBH87]